MIITLEDIETFFSKSNVLLGLSFSGVFRYGEVCIIFGMVLAVSLLPSQFWEGEKFWGAIF